MSVDRLVSGYLALCADPREWNHHTHNVSFLVDWVPALDFMAHAGECVQLERHQPFQLLVLVVARATFADPSQEVEEVMTCEPHLRKGKGCTLGF